MKNIDAKRVVADPENDDQLQRLISQVLEQEGSLIPATPQTVAEAEQVLDSQDLDLPPSLVSFEAALKRAAERRVVPCTPLKISSGMEENLARAAREGGEVPPEVEAKMQADRDLAEGDAHGQGDD